MTSNVDGSNSERKNSSRTWARWLLLVVVVVTAVVMFVQFGHELTWDSLIRRETFLRQLADNRPWVVYGGAFLLYVAATGLSLPGASLLTLAYGWFFGMWRALVLVSFASTCGATVAFLLSRLLFRDAIQRRFGERLVAFNEALSREGAFYLFTLRLIPQVPFFLINVAMGLTPIRVTTFWWVSQLGMLPGTCVYVYAGSSVSRLETFRDEGVSGIVNWQLLLAFTVLGLFPLVVKKGVETLSRMSCLGRKSSE